MPASPPVVVERTGGTVDDPPRIALPPFACAATTAEGDELGVATNDVREMSELTANAAPTEALLSAADATVAAALLPLILVVATEDVLLIDV